MHLNTIWILKKQLNYIKKIIERVTFIKLNAEIEHFKAFHYLLVYLLIWDKYHLKIAAVIERFKMYFYLEQDAFFAVFFISFQIKAWYDWRRE